MKVDLLINSLFAAGTLLFFAGSLLNLARSLGWL